MKTVIIKFLFVFFVLITLLALLAGLLLSDAIFIFIALLAIVAALIAYYEIRKTTYNTSR